MIEAQIICTCPSIWIADLNLSMKKGQSALISEIEAKRSKDLALANKNGAVTVTYIERFKELRPPVANVPDTVPAPSKMVKKIVLPEEPVRESGLDEDALVERLMAKLGFLKDSKPDGRIDELMVQINSLKELLVNQSRQVVVEKVVSGGKVENKDDIPVFIPGKIMNESAEDIDLKLKETESEGSVDAASEALRALRQKKKTEKKS